jgi:hypothetical protein
MLPSNLEIFEMCTHVHLCFNVIFHESKLKQYGGSSLNAGFEDICLDSSATEHHDQEFSTSCANVITSGADFVKWFAENVGQIIDYLSTPTFRS